jgi:hypothetical protein
VTTAIVALIPGAVVFGNKIPRSYVDYEMYNNLKYNADETDTYNMIPRNGSFEVSFKGFVSNFNGLLNLPFS